MLSTLTSFFYRVFGFFKPVHKDYRILVNMVLGDRDKAGRLIRYEHDRMKPRRISHHEAVKRAIYRIGRM